MQFISISLMWVFTFGIMVLVPWLVFVAARWQDALNWSLVISLIYLPVYFTVAATLTYAYFGLQRGAPKDGPPPDEKAGP
jgi:hypothetical protein